MVLNQSKEKPFQKLIFIVRDWPNSDETGYGWNGQKEIDEILAENDKQVTEMKNLRTRIKSSFGNITAFLMPHPGMKVAEGKSNGKFKDVDPKFKKYVKELVPDLLAPENLIIKKIAGQKLRISDLVSSLQTYLDILLNLPKPESIFAVIFISEYSLI